MYTWACQNYSQTQQVLSSIPLPLHSTRFSTCILSQLMAAPCTHSLTQGTQGLPLLHHSVHLQSLLISAHTLVLSSHCFHQNLDLYTRLLPGLPASSLEALKPILHVTFFFLKCKYLTTSFLSRFLRDKSQVAKFNLQGFPVCLLPYPSSLTLFCT